MIGRLGVLAALAALSLGSGAVAQVTASPVELPGYEAVDGLDDYATPEEYAAAVADTDFVLERLTYGSEGLRVHAYLYRPARPAGPLPVIVFNRGSYVWPDFSAQLVTMANRLARQGYLVVAPMYRGSGGAEGRDEMGGADLADLMSLHQVIAALPYADSDRLYLYGESRGGMMVYQALRDGFPAKAAAVVGAFTDLEALLQDEQWAGIGEAIWPDLATRREEIVARRSALHWPERIGVPVLILHGSADPLVAPAQSVAMGEALTAAGKPHRLTIVEGGSHTLGERAAERDAWVLDWFAGN